MIGHKRIPSREGGVEIVVYELSKRMVDLGYRVDAYNRRGSHVAGKKFVNQIGKVHQGIRILSIPTFENGKLNAIVYSFLATLRALFGRYDIIHYHAEGPCSVLWIPKLFGIRCVATIHGLDWQRAKWGDFATKVLKFGEKMAAKYADEIIVLSENVQNYFMETYDRNTKFIPNGITRPERKEIQEIKERWGLEKDGYILFLARIVPEKGIHYLIEAYQRINTEKKLVIAGGRSHSTDYFESLISMANGNENIIFTDFVGGRVLEELFSNAYCFVLPSDVEGMSIGLLEAMSYGNCCLVSDIKENAEVVEDKGELFLHSNVDSLEEKLRKLLEHSEVVDKYKREACDYICQKYSWEKVVEETLKLY
ncbi:MAG: glycosyltransferase family 4 protein [Lachnospiraceae bacterium]|nr:glycosyltransferase family 4 protein [Lachnospiraceae bacterium]